MKKTHIEKYFIKFIHFISNLKKQPIINHLRANLTSLQKHSYYRAMRLDSPTIFLLYLFPALWAIGLTAHSFLQILFYFPIFTLGALVMRSAGCIINDLADQKYDRQVKRVANRPIAKGELSLRDTVILLVTLLIIALLILTLLPKTAILIGLFAIIPVVIYPYMKRLTHYAQVFLGFTLNIGVLIGWYTIKSGFSLLALALYISAICWTIGYDTIYAHQDKEDDSRIGLKSLALKLADNTSNAVWWLYKIMMLAIGIVALNFHMNLLFYIGWGIALYHLYWQTQTLEINNPANCGKIFRSNVPLGFIILVSILLGRL